MGESDPKTDTLTLKPSECLPEVCVLFVPHDSNAPTFLYIMYMHIIIPMRIYLSHYVMRIRMVNNK